MQKLELLGTSEAKRKNLLNLIARLDELNLCNYTLKSVKTTDGYTLIFSIECELIQEIEYGWNLVVFNAVDSLVLITVNEEGELQEYYEALVNVEKG